MSKVPSFKSLQAKPIGRAPVFYKSAQDAMPLGQGMGGVTTGRPDEMQAPESADEEVFENDFSTLAYQFVHDRAPALMPYMLGFEVVDRSDDGSKAVGIYGYKIDDDFYYIPVFFINNQIRGVDMILNKRTNSFMPLTESWINYIINRHSITLGKAVNSEVNQTLEQPDLEFLRAPKYTKAASAEPMWSLKTAWSIMKEQAEKMASADPLVKEMFNGVLRAVKGAQIKKAESANYINGFMRTVGGPEAQVSLLKTFKNIKFANAALTFYKDLDAFNETNVNNAFLHKQAMAKKAAVQPKLKVVTAADVTVEDGTSTDEEEARQILTRNFTIKDTRPDSETADISDDEQAVDYDKRFSTPTEVGKYSFVMADGKLREGFLLSLTHSDQDMADKSSTVVYFPEDKIVAMAPAESILVDTGTEAATNGSSFQELFDKAKDKSSIEPSSATDDEKAYLFIGPDGQTFMPVTITAVFKDGDDLSFRTGYCGSYDYTVRTNKPTGDVDFGSWDISDRFHDANGYRKNRSGMDVALTSDLIRFCDGITRPSVNANGILLPDSWKVVEVASARPWKTPVNGTQEEIDAKRSENEKKRQEYQTKYTFGSVSDILCMLQNNGTRVKIASIGPDEFHIHVEGFKQSPRLTYKEAAITLVSHFGTRPKAAFGMLDKAASSGSVNTVISNRGQVKEAQGVGVNMPMPTDQMASVDPYTGIPVYADPYVDVQRGQMTGVPSLPEEGGLTPGIADGSEIQRAAEGPQDSMKPIDQQAQELAEQAAQAGQKHVFDQAAVGGLSKVYDTSAVIDSYMPNFMDTLDRLGRVLFLFYWKHDDFNSRYGSDDVVIMEDRLRSVFKQLGDLTLKLKEKAVHSN